MKRAFAALAAASLTLAATARADDTDDAFLRDLRSQSQWATLSFDSNDAVSEAHYACANIGTARGDSAVMTDIIRKFIDPNVDPSAVDLTEMRASTQFLSAPDRHYCPGKKM
ncbi:DUF732 domain-containing protein [Mycobacterium sp. E787]|uniref:DUF732 domain-containing protein n=1 Tax=Mycobacterium sp. E787 TaxID=1834150 RepID=UPI0018D44E16|nr:DUF732 domain-containing protein [Mycobacterium sp. E787]